MWLNPYLYYFVGYIMSIRQKMNLFPTLNQPDRIIPEGAATYWCLCKDIQNALSKMNSVYEILLSDRIQFNR